MNLVFPNELGGSMKQSVFTILGGLALGLSVQTTNASLIDTYSDQLNGETLWASSSVFRGDFTQTPGRDDPANAYGPPNGDFFSLGLDGFIGFSFDGRSFTKGGIATVWEVTNGSVYAWPEAADFLVGLESEGVFFEVFGPVLNQDAQNGFSFLVPDLGFSWDTMLAFDETDEVCGLFASCFGDGFDVSAISFQPFRDDVSQVPVPATVPLFAAGLAGLLYTRRRKAA